MPGVVIPLIPSVPHYRVATTLADVTYVIDVRWNTREAAWYMDVFQEDETPIRQGIKIVLGTALGNTTIDPEWPPGYFYATDTSGQGLDAGLDDMGERVILVWYEASEVV